MAPPPPKSEYLHPDFDSNSLTIPQLRSILLEYDVPHPAVAKKAEFVAIFDERVRPRANKILSAVQVRASNRGITVVSENGSETASVGDAPAKRRGRPRKTVAVDLDGDEPEPLEPPAKKPRGRPRKTLTATAEPEEKDVPVVPARTPRVGRQTMTPVVEVSTSAVTLGSPVTPGARRPEVPQSHVKEEVDDGEEAEIEDEPKRAPPSARKGKGRASTSNALPAPGPSAPSSTRRRTMNINPGSSDLQVPESHESKTPGRTPSKSRSTNSLRHVVEVKEEESEKEDEPVPKSVKKTPRRSIKEDAGAFSDYNPFQSGSEAAAERDRRRRKSSIGLSQSKTRQPRYSEPAPKPYTPPGILRRVGPSPESLRTPSSDHKEAMVRDRDAYTADDYNREVEERFDLQRQVHPQQKVAQLADQPDDESLIHRLDRIVPGAKTPQFAIPMSILLMLLLSLLGNYKSNSASLGFCDTASDTNDLILNRQSKLDDAKACVARRANLELDDHEAAKAMHCEVSALPLIPFTPRPTSCTTCPAHAVCQDGALVACQPEYILSAHPLAFLAPVVDGLPGVGPVAFSPTCRPDTARKRMIGGLAMEMERELARGRGDIICNGAVTKDSKKGDGVKYGVTEQTLLERFAARRDPKFSREMFVEIFDAALNDLVQHDDVVESIDVDGLSYYASTRTELTLSCRAKLELLSLLSRWKSQLGSSLAVIATILWLRSTILRRKEEKYRAEELVQVVLKRLQDQETLHYADPVTTANPFIPPAQLRDLVLPPTGSKTSRNRLWQSVTDLIEANSNVAVREKEVRGELWKTWEWQGVGERRVTWEN